MPRRSRRWQIELDQPRGWVDPLLRKLEDLSLPPPPYTKRHWVWDDRIFGFGLMITEKGKQSFVFQCRIGGKSKRLTFRGRDVADARKWAANLALKLESGTLAPTSPAPRSYDDKTLRRVVHEYVAFRGSGYRSRKEFERSLHNHVLPVLGERPYESITRRDLAALRDGIIAKVRQAAIAKATTPKKLAKAQDAGRHASHDALKNLNTIWTKYYRDHASDTFTWPKIRSPLEAEDRNGKGRLLSDREIAEIWHAMFHLAPNRAAYWRFLFYSGMRRTFAARIAREQVVGDVLHIPGSVTKPAYELPLSGPAAELLKANFEGPWAFAPLGPFATLKRELDGKLFQVAPWTIHHIRHTVRSLLSKVTTPDIAELCLGHALKGMRKVYDHHLYEPEKREAMEKLATLLHEIVSS
jgi:hypothetical protein